MEQTYKTAVEVSVPGGIVRVMGDRITMVVPAERSLTSEGSLEDWTRAMHGRFERSQIVDVKTPWRDGAPKKAGSFDVQNSAGTICSVYVAEINELSVRISTPDVGLSFVTSLWIAKERFIRHRPISAAAVQIPIEWTPGPPGEGSVGGLFGYEFKWGPKFAVTRLAAGSLIESNGDTVVFRESWRDAVEARFNPEDITRHFRIPLPPTPVRCVGEMVIVAPVRVRDKAMDKRGLGWAIPTSDGAKVVFDRNGVMRPCRVGIDVEIVFPVPGDLTDHP